MRCFTFSDNAEACNSRTTSNPSVDAPSQAGINFRVADNSEDDGDKPVS